jgi:putative transposase
LPRKVIPWFPGAKYHITSRGVRRCSLFHKDEDREEYLAILEETMNRHPFILHAYCLMTNHIHLQIQTKNTKTGKIMMNINRKYANYFNKKYHHSGHVFDKRYGAEFIDSSEYELELSKYIHLNPLKASMVERLEDYKWSSYLVYIHNVKSSLVSTQQILSYFPEPQIQLYEKYLKSGYTDMSFSDNGTLLFDDHEEIWR